ncbi:P63C domain-containing protein [Caballeronia sp. DA-9]|uniref:P63C domain-containing protein n=1 Tax=Caballeronia sp. DA-9 TaxID=3436237 RepID=UPI003F6691D3
MKKSDSKVENSHKPVSGRAKGGIARKEKLTPERRSEIARNAAKARHAPSDPPELPVATHKGVLTIGDLKIPCFVLNDGRRVISGRGMTAAIGMKGRGQGIARISGLRAINSLENKALSLAIGTPIQFLGGSPKIGDPSDGFEATVLQDLCEALLIAQEQGVLTTEHEKRYAQFASMLIRSFARVGILGLVDEATGYQAVRPGDALQQYLQMLVRKELAVWAKKFPDEYYENIYKLRGWTWPGMGKNRYSVVAHYTRDLVYERMAPGLLKDLEDKSPKDEKGARENKLHQWLTGDIGDPMLASHLQSILTLQRLAIANGWGWQKFMNMVDQVMKKKGQTLDLPFSPDEGASPG